MSDDLILENPPFLRYFRHGGKGKREGNGVRLAAPGASLGQ